MSDAWQALFSLLPCKPILIMVEGHAAFLLLPSSSALSDRLPWVWFAPTLAGLLPDVNNLWLFSQLLESGVAVTGVDVGESCGNPAGRRTYDAFYARLTAEFRLAKRPCLLPQSRGGLMIYNWAADRPQQVACIAGIFPICDLGTYPLFELAAEAYRMDPGSFRRVLHYHNPVERLAPLAEADVPIFHVHGDNDQLVPLQENSVALARRYRNLGGHIELLVVPGRGHETTSEFFECRSLLQFLLRHAHGIKAQDTAHPLTDGRQESENHS